MTDPERTRLGTAVRRDVLGDDHGDRAVAANRAVAVAQRVLAAEGPDGADR